ncbi:gamma carbonic anhydrase family protein [Limoniibacter endophyticus]|uniref:Gamma carbonic anhydrase family protein n=1 Tax=Limoniibacter endophyticus TaxID=1565040 RepID=A0A8J3DG08_9HYPH|nr:gamma carbonic anhydrase family protein [Limoniibacter endophyticus]GHC61981.1 gamma carbonic anhydrase family protein [Limoniibacter endophyticus]
MPIFRLGETAPVFLARETNWIAPDATLIGNLEIGRNVGIWYGSVLRGDNELIKIGDDTNVQEHCIFHTDVGFPLKLGRGCTIGHRATLHGCTIGENTLIGMGAIVLNGAKIGANSIVGAGTLVTEGKAFPDGVLIVGSPARVVRSLDELTFERMRRSAAHYVENGKRFRVECTEIDS